jgi:hypothetical protein
MLDTTHGWVLCSVTHVQNGSKLGDVAHCGIATLMDTTAQFGRVAKALRPF